MIRQQSCRKCIHVCRTLFPDGFLNDALRWQRGGVVGRRQIDLRCMGLSAIPLPVFRLSAAQSSLPVDPHDQFLVKASVPLRSRVYRYFHTERSAPPESLAKPGGANVEIPKFRAREIDDLLRHLRLGNSPRRRAHLKAPGPRRPRCCRRAPQKEPRRRCA